MPAAAADVDERGSAGRSMDGIRPESVSRSPSDDSGEERADDMCEALTVSASDERICEHAAQTSAAANELCEQIAIKAGEAAYTVFKCYAFECVRVSMGETA